MSAGDLIKDLIKAGLAPDLIARVAEELVNAARPSAPSETPEERKKRISRETSARHRASRNVTAVSPATASDGDAKRHQMSPSDAKTSPLARVERNNLTRVDNYNHTTPETRDAGDQLDWPESERPSKADLDRLQTALFDAGGPALHATAPRLLDLSPILRLAKQGRGPPCDLNADVLPVIRARSAKAQPGMVKSWDFYTEAITEARDRRLSGAPAQQPGRPHERPNSPTAKRTAREDNYARSFAGFEAAVDGLRVVAGGG